MSAAIAVESAARSFVRTEDILKCILEGHAIQHNVDYEGNTTSINSEEIPSAGRVFAIVTNSYETGNAEGSILIFKRVLEDEEDVSPGSFLEVKLSLLSVIPITKDVSPSMSQLRTRPITLDLRPGKYIPPQPQPMILRLQTQDHAYNLSVAPSQNLRGFIEECKALQSAPGTPSPSPEDWTWLQHYYSQCPSNRKPLPLLPRPDLRTLLEDASARLSSGYAGQPGDEEADLMTIREYWIRKSLDDSLHTYSTLRNLKIKVGTFNVNGKIPSQDMSQWIRPQNAPSSLPSTITLPPIKNISPFTLTNEDVQDYLSLKRGRDVSDTDLKERPDNSGSDPDILVLGFQELDLSTEALLLTYTTDREEMWLSSIFAALGEAAPSYTKLTSKQLVGMLIIVLVKTDLIMNVSDIRTGAVGAGFMGMLGNKGATAVRFTMYNSTVLTFVNSHLAAFDEFVDKRNADYRELVRRISFSQDKTDVDGKDGLKPTENVFQTDALFWMGGSSLRLLESDSFDDMNVKDLNYRVDLPDKDVRSLIAGNTRDYNLHDLLQHDQLMKARREKLVFEHFREGEIRHFPTYRFGLGLSTDKLGYDLKRRPAWTDRILYMTSTKRIKLHQDSYEPHPEITMSDHRPVSASFRLEVPEINRQAYKEAAEALLRSLSDFEESEKITRLKIEPREVDFGKVGYKKPVSREVQIFNVGEIPAAFRFISRSEDEPLYPSFLSIHPKLGIALPGSSVTLTLTIEIGDHLAQSFNLGMEHLQETLILHTERGKDHFILISGQYQPTCFANDIPTLCRLPGPIRRTENWEPLSPKKQVANAPREIIRLLHWLMENAGDVHDLFCTRGQPTLVNDIRESLDTGDEFPTNSDSAFLARSFAEVLVTLLQALPTSVIPAILHQKCAAQIDRDDALEMLVSGVEGATLNIWLTLTAFLACHIQRNEDRQIDGVSISEILVCFFAPILLRDNPAEAPPVSPLAKRNFLRLFIE